MTENKCKRINGSLEFCTFMENEIRKSNNEYDKSSIFTHIVLTKQGEAVLCTPIKGVINYCPFCGSKLFDKGVL